MTRGAAGAVLAVALAHAATLPASAAPVKGGASAEPKRTQVTSADSSVILRGGQEGTAFRAITVEGEDRIHFEVERPAMVLELDPTAAPGLDWGTARDVLDRTIPDTMTPLLASTASESSPYTGRPWLSHFSSGSVARFQPAVDDVERWKLVIANWRGEPVKTFSGNGKPPKELTWDGRSESGEPVMPGATYSYVLEAQDRAGNRRNFVGEGFQVSAFRVSNDANTVLSFTAAELTDRGSGAAAAGTALRPATPPVLLEAASWINQRDGSVEPVLVSVIARSADEAAALAIRVRQQLDGLLLGDASRIGTESMAASDAPAGGVVRISAGRTSRTAPAPTAAPMIPPAGKSKASAKPASKKGK